VPVATVGERLWPERTGEAIQDIAVGSEESAKDRRSPMTDNDSFLQAINERPADTGLRLVYAD
jgi:hypothetical protein